MALRNHKTKLVCTIGPASDSVKTMQEMIRAGMSVARLNFSHGNFEWHANVIRNLREAAAVEGMPITIMGDLPGPKMRIGILEEEVIMLQAGDILALTSDDIIGDKNRISVSIPNLSEVVKEGDLLFLNDGNIELEVIGVSNGDTRCRVMVGGELRSRKGLNLPGTNLGISAFTERDHECLKFAMEHGVDAVSQSFVESAKDIQAVREAAAAMGVHPFVIAKIERAAALTHLEEIIDAADGIMIARGDLGVETRLERMAVLQKQLIRKVNAQAKPIITATQMLESMTHRSRPTRAEATDVANAILDGTDCVMLSEESAMGRSPVGAVRMLARIAIATEPHRVSTPEELGLTEYHREGDIRLGDMISRSVNQMAGLLRPNAVVAPSVSGHTAQLISRFKLPMWTIAVSDRECTCRALQFSYGVVPIHVDNYPEDWASFIGAWMDKEGITKELAILIQGPSPKNPNANPRIEIIDLKKTAKQ